MDKYIQRMKKALEDFNVVAKDCVAQYELAKQTDVENGTSFHVEMANERLIPLHEEAARKARAEIAAAYNEAVSEVSRWGCLDGSKIDANDLALLEGGYPLTGDDLRRMALRHEGNHTMLTRIEAYAEKNGKIMELGYIPSPADKLTVYSSFRVSAMSMVDTIYTHGGIADGLLNGFADPTHVTDPRFIVGLSGLAALYEHNTNEAEEKEQEKAAFDFKFRPAAPNPTRW
ncbi:MAG: hypothetical protein MSS53_02175 [Oscillibacter sp.]|nr:hypothetical protein [Oscillibacter sp.]